MTDLYDQLGFVNSLTLTKNNVKTLTKIPDIVRRTIYTTASGIWASPQPLELVFEKVGNTITMCWSRIFSPATISAQIVVDTLAPEQFRPMDGTSACSCIARVMDNSVGVIGLVVIHPSGTIEFYVDGDDNDFVGAGTGGLYAGCTSYLH